MKMYKLLPLIIIELLAKKTKLAGRKYKKFKDVYIYDRNN